MKKLALGLLSLFLVVGSINAQEGKKALKKGSKLLVEYGKNASVNADKLSEGLSLIAKALESDEVSGNAKMVNQAADAYKAVVRGQINAVFLDPTFKIANGGDLLQAVSLYKKAMELDPKKGVKKALAGLVGVQANAIDLSSIYGNTQDYANAYTYAKQALDLHTMLADKGGKSNFSDDALLNDHKYFTAATGYYSQNGADVASIFEDLIATGTDKSLPYEALYNTYAADNKEKAVGFLEKGRAAFPEDTGLLFAEINYYLTEGKLDVLTGKLKTALEQEPDNITIYTTLGNVYDQLNQGSRDAGDLAKADEYFAESMSYYDQALAKDPANFDAVYSQGALYYNKAASLTGKINELANDFSAAGTKKYDALKKEMDGYFGEAMPYFIKAEGMNGKDLNTLVALREIYARQSKMDKVGEYKAKIEAIQAGGGE